LENWENTPFIVHAAIHYRRFVPFHIFKKLRNALSLSLQEILSYISKEKN